MGAEEIKPNGISEVIANEHDLTHFNNRGLWLRHVMLKCIANGGLDARLLEQSSNKGDIPVCHYEFFMHSASSESRFLGMECKVGGKFHVKINMSLRPLINFSPCSLSSSEDFLKKAAMPE